MHWLLKTKEIKKAGGHDKKSSKTRGYFMNNLFPVRIKWLDDASELDVLIAESDGIDDLPEGYEDEDIFFFGMSENAIKQALASGEPCENEWVIIEFFGTDN
jgi:hypothetical protein